jgi:hypothetical protein
MVVLTTLRSNPEPTNIGNQKDQEFDYIDGSFTDWTSKLLVNKKKKILTSKIGVGFLLRTCKVNKV